MKAKYFPTVRESITSKSKSQNIKMTVMDSNTLEPCAPIDSLFFELPWSWYFTTAIER